MKKIYKVATHLDLKINHLKRMGGLFNRILKTEEDAWVNFNAKYIYAETIEEALNKYEKLFGKKHTSFWDWMRWCESSKNIDVPVCSNLEIPTTDFTTELIVFTLVFSTFSSLFVESFVVS